MYWLFHLYFALFCPSRCSYMTVGCSALKLILKNFASMIKTNITAPPGVGVDISREERWVFVFSLNDDHFSNALKTVILCGIFSQVQQMYELLQSTAFCPSIHLKTTNTARQTRSIVSWNVNTDAKFGMTQHDILSLSVEPWNIVCVEKEIKKRASNETTWSRRRRFASSF